jgi:uncharacterized protein (DUF169 family)
MMAHTTLTELLDLEWSPVAISFVDEPPRGMRRVTAGEPASCGYWRRAAAGEVFYTAAEDHKSCPIGAHTHNVLLSAEERRGAEDLVRMMVGLSYLKMEEVAQIPSRKFPLRVAVYAPLERATVPPDVVVVRGNARQLMLVSEAAQAAGVAGAAPVLGRPTCAMLPVAIESGRATMSLGCIGNRVYTGARDDEAYVAIPGERLRAIEEQLAAIVKANRELEKFHRARAAR